MMGAVTAVMSTSNAFFGKSSYTVICFELDKKDRCFVPGLRSAATIGYTTEFCFPFLLAFWRQPSSQDLVMMN